MPTEPFYSELGRRIQHLRTHRSLSQQDLAARLTPPTTRASIANIEAGKQRVLVHTLLQLSDALGVDTRELLAPAPASIASPAVITEELRSKLRISPERLGIITQRIER